jgi:cytochrome c-type protein NapC
MRAQDSVTCRSCHEAGAIAPKSEAGRAAHARVGKGGATCVDCHRNLVHAPASPLGEPVSK